MQSNMHNVHIAGGHLVSDYFPSEERRVPLMSVAFVSNGEYLCVCVCVCYNRLVTFV